VTEHRAPALDCATPVRPVGGHVNADRAHIAWLPRRLSPSDYHPGRDPPLGGVTGAIMPAQRFREALGGYSASTPAPGVTVRTDRPDGDAAGRPALDQRSRSQTTPARRRSLRRLPGLARDVAHHRHGWGWRDDRTRWRAALPRLMTLGSEFAVRRQRAAAAGLPERVGSAPAAPSADRGGQAAERSRHRADVEGPYELPRHVRPGHRLPASYAAAATVRTIRCRGAAVERRYGAPRRDCPAPLSEGWVTIEPSSCERAS